MPYCTGYKINQGPGRRSHKKRKNMLNGFYDIFVSKTGRHDETAFLWVETKSEEIFQKALKDVEPRGYKVSKIYYPTDRLDAPNFANCINKKRTRK